MTGPKVLVLDSRFWSKVNMLAPGGCMEWTAGADGYGYGLFRLSDGKLRRSHIASYEDAYGVDLPRGKVVRHKCDNPPCVNPEHLEMGTYADNVRDREERGRGVRLTRETGHAGVRYSDDDVAYVMTAPWGQTPVRAKEVGMPLQYAYQLRYQAKKKGAPA